MVFGTFDASCLRLDGLKHGLSIVDPVFRSNFGCSIFVISRLSLLTVSQSPRINGLFL